MRSSKSPFDSRTAFTPQLSPQSPTRSIHSARSNDPLRVSISDLSSALVREFLLSSGYRKTLESFAKEDYSVILLYNFKRKDTKIEDRSELFNLLGLDKIIDSSIGILLVNV